MEDYFDIGYLLKPAAQQKPNEWPYEYFYFGVFDGHGGFQAANFAKQHLLKFITTQELFWSHDDGDILSAIKTGFAKTHAAMHKDMRNWSRTSDELPSTAGTTASVLFIRNNKFYTGHVGDSRIVIANKHTETNNWLHKEFTQDHKPENEVDRIELAGGEVKSKIGVHRVVWKKPVLTREMDELLTDPDNAYSDLFERTIESYPINDNYVESYQKIPFLAIARSLGDFWSYNPESGEFVVSPEPDVMCRPIDKSDKCILLATDGLWNVINSAQAIRFLQELFIVKEGNRTDKPHSGEYFSIDNFYDVSTVGNEKNHALSLVFLAFQIWERRRLRSDNITAIVAMLSDILTPKSTDLNQSSSGPARTKFYTPEYIEANTVQLGQTRIFCENISYDKKPKFEVKDGTNTECSHLTDLEDYILLPPGIIGTNTDLQRYVKTPQNYTRLSDAKCHKIPISKYSDDIFIYVKEVSDDPSDSIKLPSRINHKKIEVRDSSAQATQPMHDFGQPWDQLTDDQQSPTKEKEELSDVEEIYEPALESIEGIMPLENDDDDEDLEDEEEEEDEEGDLDDNDLDCLYVNGEEVLDRILEKSDKVLNSFLERDDDEDKEDDFEIVTSDEVDDTREGSHCRHDNADLSQITQLDALVQEMISHTHSSNASGDADDDQQTFHAIDQVLAVVSENKTPISCRTTRRSATENPKRKLDIEIVLSPKSKRRRSHPIHTMAVYKS